MVDRNRQSHYPLLQDLPSTDDLFDDQPDLLTSDFGGQHPLPLPDDQPMEDDSWMIYSDFLLTNPGFV